MTKTIEIYSQTNVVTTKTSSLREARELRETRDALACTFVTTDVYTNATGSTHVYSHIG